MRRRRWRWVAVALILAIGLYFVADVVLLQYLESRGAAEIARTMSAEDATVDLGGVPFIPNFFAGRLSDVTVKVSGASASGGLRVHSLEARFARVDFDAGKMFTLARSSFSTRSDVKGTDSFGRLELVENDVEEYIRRQIPLVGDVHIKATGVEIRFLRDADLIDEPFPDEKKMTKPARFLPRVDGRTFVLDLTSVSQLDPRFRLDAARIEKLIELPKVPEGLSAEVNLGNGVIVLEAQGAEVTLDVGEGDKQDA